MADILSFPIPPEAADAPIPFIDLVAQYREIAPAMSEAVAKVFTEQKFILGEEVTLLETEVATYCDAREAIGCASGTDALLLALMALDIGPGDEVITTPYTFFATASTIVRAGATPVFVDVDRETLNLDPEAVAAAITPRTRAIMPVHLFGQCADMDPLWRLATQHGIEIIEDACQAIGAEYHGRRAGVLGRVACFSFFPTKNLGGAGDGGMLTTDDLQLAKRLKKLRVHGESSQYHHDEVGLNSRLDALQAAVLRVKLPHLESWTYGRQANAAHYEILFDAFGVQDLLEVPATPATYRHVYNQYCVRVRDEQRDKLFAGLRERKIGCMIYYPRPLHLQECFANLGYRPGSLPVAEQAALETIALPIFSELTEMQQERVVRGMAEVFGIQRDVPRSSIPCRVHPGVRELERRRRESA